ncbi:MAG: YggT family protein [Tissierellales bacterium]|jgi:YggT family protein|nr:YggT family protein [Tissierellales bacterium]MBN2827678.1 YggT family protein [Tissierellales bacterium]
MSIFLNALDKLISIIELLIFVRIILSYIPDLRASKVAEIVFQLTEPILYPVRELFAKLGLNKGMIDFSPIGAFLILNIIRSLLFRIF